MPYWNVGHNRGSLMRRTILAAFVASLLLPSVLFAHGGGLDRHGCHRETATGGYHCHRKKDDDPDWGVIAGVAGGLLLLWLIVDLTKDDMSLTQPLQIVPTFTEEGEAGITADYLLGHGQRIGFHTSTQTEDGRDETIVGLHWQLEF